MKNIFVIAIKELRAYFTQPMAYILLVVFLALTNFFYFRPILITGESSLRPLFNVLPWLLMFFVSAVTMALVAKEKESGTFELLAVQPVESWQLVAGKITGAFIFIMGAVFLTLSAPLSLASFANFDWGIIFAQYLGTAFLVLAVVTVGTAASAIARNQVLAFILAISVNFLLIIAGFELVLLSVPYPLDVVLKNLSVLPHFYNIARGVLDLRDAIYFLSLVGCFFLVAWWSVLRTRSRKFLSGFNRWGGLIIIFLIVVFVLNMGGDYVKGRIDLTQGRVYTLAAGTKTILADLKQEINVDFVVSKEMPAQLETSARDVRDLLNDYQNESKGKIKVNIYHPDTEGPAKAEELGIPAVQFNVIQKDQFQTKKGYFGLAIATGEGEGARREIIPFVERTDNLEYRLTSLIAGFIKQEKKKIGWLTGHGERQLFQDFAYLNEELSKQYALENLSLTKKEGEDDAIAPIADDVALIIIAGPKENFTGKELEQLIAYLNGGGSIFAMEETVETDLQFLSATTSESYLGPLLKESGLTVNKDLVYDLKSHDNVSLRGGYINYILPYPLWPRLLKKEAASWLNNIDSLVCPWSSSLEIREEGSGNGWRLTKIFTTSDAAGSLLVDMNIDPQRSWPENDLGEKLMIASAEKENGNNLSRLLLSGSVNFASAEFVNGQPENKVFMLNAIEWLAQDDLLSGIRAKNIERAPLLFSSEAQKNRVKYFNIIFMPLLVALAGTLVIVRRRKLARRKFFSE